ncbi:MAG: ABC transporter ATP-binding protein [Gracilibacteraceae bacterium]|jgi:ABC-type nitrate/sulfonate/bicarbonate transport system ATPase subunit|nr:ABC transporter ATP-binding protein [Gracilibacteraceae bacterium]
MLFSCENISKYYNGAAVVKDINLNLPEKSSVSLLGPSGTGKTTVFNILAGVSVPDGGSVRLRGENITGKAGYVSYMPQNDLLMPYRTVLDNIILPLIIGGQSKKEAREYAGDFLPKFGLADCAHKYPRQISGGMKQRAALLRTFFMDKPVILLDEPFSALDVITKIHMHKWFLSIAEEMGLSTLFITHDIDEAISLSDFVYILQGSPGAVCAGFELLPRKSREKDFIASAPFAAAKKEILNALGLGA